MLIILCILLGALQPLAFKYEINKRILILLCYISRKVKVFI